MPELPEVEICARQLAAHLRGRIIREVISPDAKIQLPDDLTGRHIEDICRRGKFITLRLDDDRRLLVHLGMTGWFVFTPVDRCRLTLRTSDGVACLEDPRRFAKVRLVSSAQQEAILARLGPDPLAPGFDLNCLKTTRRAVKVALMDQRLIAGVGNIYANEALWRARIHPAVRADWLRKAALLRLRAAIIRVLRKAIARGPRIFEAQQFAVYGRKGEPCRRCRAPIGRLTLGGRSAYYCPSCQRSPRQRPRRSRATGARSVWPEARS